MALNAAITLRRDARLLRFSISSCHCAMNGKFRIVAARNAEQLIDHDFCLASLDGHPPKNTRNDEVRHQTERREDRAPTQDVQADNAAHLDLEKQARQLDRAEQAEGDNARQCEP
jgi:hypothetical protein